MSSILTFLRNCMRWVLTLFGETDGVEPRLMVTIRSGGQHLPLPLDPQWNVLRVKEAVAPRLGLRPADLDIVLAGKRLSNSTTIQVIFFTFFLFLLFIFVYMFDISGM